MKRRAKNLQAARWTDDPAQREKFLNEVEPKIDGESKLMARRYRVGMYQEDIKSETQLGYLQRMDQGDTDGPFAKDSPEDAADVFKDKENYQIRERAARPLARKEFTRQSRQAELLANVCQKELLPDFEAQLFAIAKGLPLIISRTPNLTPRESKIFRKEALRRVDIDSLPADVFDQVAQAAEISASEEREYIKDHDENGHSNASDRQAWHRACAKVKKALTQAALKLLLALAFALSLASLNAIHQGRSINQDDFVNQGKFIHQKALAYHGNLKHQKALAQLDDAIHQ